MKKIIKLIKTFTYPRTRDGNDYNFKFTISDSDNSNNNIHDIKVGVSGTMQALWKINQENIDVEKACYEYGKKEIISLLKNQTLLDKQELEILTTTHPKECPFNTDKTYYKIGAVEDLEIE